MASKQGNPKKLVSPPGLSTLNQVQSLSRQLNSSRVSSNRSIRPSTLEPDQVWQETSEEEEDEQPLQSSPVESSASSFPGDPRDFLKNFNQLNKSYVSNYIPPYKAHNMDRGGFHRHGYTKHSPQSSGSFQPRGSTFNPNKGGAGTAHSDKEEEENVQTYEEWIGRKKEKERLASEAESASIQAVNERYFLGLDEEENLLGLDDVPMVSNQTTTTDEVETTPNVFKFAADYEIKATPKASKSAATHIGVQDPEYVRKQKVLAEQQRKQLAMFSLSKPSPKDTKR